MFSINNFSYRVYSDSHFFYFSIFVVQSMDNSIPVLESPAMPAIRRVRNRVEENIEDLLDNVEEVANLTKKYEEELAAAKRDRESAFKTMNIVQAGMNAKDERIKALAEENKTALAELATLKQEKANWGAEKDNLEAAIGEQYEEGFQFGLEQVKVLFPDLDPDVLGRADAMSTIEGDKLVPHAPAETVPNSPAKESPTEEPSAQGSPA
jgi:flagellar biosynthesis GTPase FlhF